MHLLLECPLARQWPYRQWARARACAKPLCSCDGRVFRLPTARLGAAPPYALDQPCCCWPAPQWRVHGAGGAHSARLPDGFGLLLAFVRLLGGSCRLRAGWPARLVTVRTPLAIGKLGHPRIAALSLEPTIAHAGYHSRSNHVVTTVRLCRTLQPPLAYQTQPWHEVSVQRRCHHLLEPP